MSTGTQIYNDIVNLFPIFRSLLGPGVRQTLAYFSSIHPEMTLQSVNSGEQVFDWQVPNEWRLTEARLTDSSGKDLSNFKENNLRVIQYSQPITAIGTKSELKKYIYTLPDQKNAIPYVTSFYAEKTGICMKQEEYDAIKSDEILTLTIDASFEPGTLDYAEIIIPGQTSKEIFFSTYICHPSMANNELSGPCVASQLAKAIKKKDNYYTYRFVFLPETIGAIAYLDKNVSLLKENVLAGFQLTCIGDDGPFSYIPSRAGNTLSDRVLLHLLKNKYANRARYYSWLDRGSDERQYCAPGIDLPHASVTRSRYGEFPEYHTSLDDLTFVTPQALEESFQFYSEVIEIIEHNKIVTHKVLGEPQLGKRGLYQNINVKNDAQAIKNSRDFINVCSLADGRDALAIAETLNLDFSKLKNILLTLEDNQLVSLTR
jgi:aminopeptidase-like protein